MQIVQVRICRAFPTPPVNVTLPTSVVLRDTESSVNLRPCPRFRRSLSDPEKPEILFRGFRKHEGIECASPYGNHGPARWLKGAGLRVSGLNPISGLSHPGKHSLPCFGIE